MNCSRFHKLCEWKLKRLLVYVGGIALTIGFLKMSYKGLIQPEMFILYPIGLVILYSPQLSLHMLSLWKGIPVQLEPADKKGDQNVEPIKE